MDIRDYTRVLRRNWLLITAIALGGLLLAGLASVLIKPTYTSQTQLFVAAQTSGTLADLQQGNTFSQARVQSYVKTVTTPVVLQPAIDSLGLSISPEELATRVQATADVNTVLINISVSDASPAQAKAIAQAVANSLIAAVDTLEKPKSGGPTAVALSIITPAQTPSTPSAPNTRINLLLGVLLGFAVGITTAILRTKLDTRVRGEADLRQVTSAPLLGGIAFDPDATRKPLLTQSPQQSPRAESYRQLRTNLQFANVSGRAKTILVTSSVPGEGKTTTATNMAIALAQAGQTVCLVDADLRRPMVGEYLGLDKTIGLTTSLIGEADVNDVLQPWGDENLFVLTSGSIPPNPSELLGSDEMKFLLNRLEDAFDTVIVDTPPLLPVTDAAVLAHHAGGVVLVVGSQKLKNLDLEKALKALELVDANLLGVVLNQLPIKGPDTHAYGYYSQRDSEVSDRSSSGSGQYSADFDTKSQYENALSMDGSRPARTFPLRKDTRL